MQAHPAITHTTRLARGQSLHLQACAGTRIVAASGSIEVCEPPTCLGERMVVQRFALRDGEQYLVLQRGWISIQAQEPAELLCVAPEAGVSAFACLRFLETWMTLCLRRIRPRRPA